jgi:hypothetical protein
VVPKGNIDAVLRQLNSKLVESLTLDVERRMKRGGVLRESVVAGRPVFEIKREPESVGRYSLGHRDHNVRGLVLAQHDDWLEHSVGHLESARPKSHSGILRVIYHYPERSKDGQYDLLIRVVRGAIFTHVGRGHTVQSG